MPEDFGTCLKNCSSASRPPAEAPSPTIGNEEERGLAAAAVGAAGLVRCLPAEGGLGLTPLVVFFMQR